MWVGGMVTSWLVCLTLERAVLTGDIALCSWVRHFTLMVLLSTQVNKWVPVNLMLIYLFCHFKITNKSNREQTDSHDRCNGLEPCCLKSLTMYKWAIEPFDIVTIRIHNHDLIAADWHGQQKDCTKRHCQGKGTQPKPAKCHVLSYK